MLEQSRQQPLVMGIALHAYIVGQLLIETSQKCALHISNKEDICLQLQDRLPPMLEQLTSELLTYHRAY